MQCQFCLPWSSFFSHLLVCGLLHVSECCHCSPLGLHRQYSFAQAPTDLCGSHQLQSTVSNAAKDAGLSGNHSPVRGSVDEANCSYRLGSRSSSGALASAFPEVYYPLGEQVFNRGSRAPSPAVPPLGPRQPPSDCPRGCEVPCIVPRGPAANPGVATQGAAL